MDRSEQWRNPAGSVAGGTNPIGWTTRPDIANNGNIGIGMTNLAESLLVDGTVRAKEVWVETTGWSDCVFGKAHPLQPLSEVEQAIEREGFDAACYARPIAFLLH